MMSTTTTIHTTHVGHPGRERTCRPAGTAATHRLLGLGAAAGPLFVTVATVQILTRDGFDLTRHPVSLLSLGTHGWIQITNFILTGVLFVAGSVGMRRAMAGARGGRWAPRLVGLLGASLIGAGVFVADPADGYPVGAATDTTWHGAAHNIAPVTASIAVLAACFVLAAYFRRQGDRRRTIAAVLLGVGMFVPDAFMGTDLFFVAVAVGAGVGWCWISYVAWHLRRETR